MCDFKVGDEVVCVDLGMRTGCKPITCIRVGQKYIVSGLFVAPHGRVLLRLDGVDLSSCFVYGGAGAWRFRKVQRRNIQEWLSQSVGNTDKLDNRQKVGA